MTSPWPPSADPSNEVSNGAALHETRGPENDCKERKYGEFPASTLRGKGDNGKDCCKCTAGCRNPPRYSHCDLTTELSGRPRWPCRGQTRPTMLHGPLERVVRQTLRINHDRL